MRLLPVAILAWLIVLVLPAAASEPPDPADGIARLVKPLVTGRVVTGIAVGVIHEGEIHRSSYGKLPAGADSVFEIGSITKVFTGYLLADMVRDGTVRLDQPVRELLPKGTTVPKHGDREITLLDLATHRSGLPRMPSNFAPKDPTNPYADYGEKRLFEYLATAKLTAKPGQRKLYSNVGMGLLGQALARKAGRSYERLVAERILRPLKLEETSITLDDAAKKRLAPGSNADLEPEPNWDLTALAGAGAIRSTVGDLLRFLAAHFAPGDGVPDLRLAWQETTSSGSFWHNGQTGGYHGMVIVVPDDTIAIAVLANTATMRIDDLGNRILRLLRGEKVEPPKVRMPVAVDAKILDRYVGRYRYSAEVVFEVSRDDRGLLVRMPGQPRRRLYAQSETTFFLRVAPVALVFKTDLEGKARSVLIRQGKQEKRAPKID